MNSKIKSSDPSLAKLCNQVSSLSLSRWRTLTLLKYKEGVFTVLFSVWLTIVSSLKHKNTQPLYIFNRENPLNSEPQNGPRRGLDLIALLSSHLNQPQLSHGLLVQVKQHLATGSSSFESRSYVCLVHLAGRASNKAGISQAGARQKPKTKYSRVKPFLKIGFPQR